MANRTKQEDIFLKQVGQNLKREMVVRKISGVDLAKMVGVTRSAISGVITGRSAPSLILLRRISFALGHTIDYFLNEDTRPRFIIKASKFINWCFNEQPDAISAYLKIKNNVKSKNATYIDVKTLFYRFDRIPSYLCENYKSSDNMVHTIDCDLFLDGGCYDS